ncbi:baseplate J/gp47 family protein [Sinorhizobium fredii]|uniref:baseplate J/gp47 family protein n=1 Tax=Rhizobium fredii TaxID=380 RepID=UPI003CC77FE2
MAQPATTVLRFALSEIRLVDVAIPKGTRVASGSAVLFVTDQDLVIPAGMTAATVAATATTPGATWNGGCASSMRSSRSPRLARATATVSM